MKKEYVIGIVIAIILLVIIVVQNQKMNKQRSQTRNALARVSKIVKQIDKNKGTLENKTVKDIFDEIVQDEKDETDEDES